MAWCTRWMQSRMLPLCLVVVFLLGSGCAQSAPLVPCTITTAQGTHTFQVELARTPEEQERGLMFRRALPQDQGMLFLYTAPQQLTFWMKNTYLPLDLLFIDTGGRIVFIKERATPLSEAHITAPVPAVAVLEINAGLVRQYGISLGDTVRIPHP